MIKERIFCDQIYEAISVKSWKFSSSLSFSVLILLNNIILKYFSLWYSNRSWLFNNTKFDKFLKMFEKLLWFEKLAQWIKNRILDNKLLENVINTGEYNKRNIFSSLLEKIFWVFLKLHFKQLNFRSYSFNSISKLLIHFTRMFLIYLKTLVALVITKKKKKNTSDF